MANVRGEISSGAEEKQKSRSLLADFFTRLLKEKPLGTAGGVIVLVFLFVAIFANVIAPYGSNEFILVDRLETPSARHLMGADHLGRDILSRIIYGARISVIVGLAGATLAMLVAIIIGIPSGFFGGKTDMVIQRFVDAFMCLPAVFLFLSVMSLLGPGVGQVILVLGIARGIRSSGLIRSAVIGIKEDMYVRAARTIGASDIRIIARHILPNIMAPIIIIFTTSVGSMILSEAFLSFLGYGIPPPIPSWGGMLSGPGRQYMIRAPHMCLFPGLALAIVVFAINMLGDALRDILDPRLRGGLGRYGRVKVGKPKLAS